MLGTHPRATASILASVEVALSPFLFVIVMAVLMHDAKADLDKRGVDLSSRLFAQELLYADDTLLIHVDDSILQQSMDCVGKYGEEYGLSFNLSKLEALSVNTTASYRLPRATR